MCKGVRLPLFDYDIFEIKPMSSQHFVVTFKPNKYQNSRTFSC